MNNRLLVVHHWPGGSSYARLETDVSAQELTSFASRLPNGESAEILAKLLGFNEFDAQQEWFEVLEMDDLYFEKRELRVKLLAERLKT